MSLRSEDYEYALNQTLERSGHKVVPFQPWHLEHLGPGSYREEVAAAFPEYPEYLAYQAQLGCSFTGISSDGNFRCVFGVVPMWPSVCEAFMLFDHDAPRFAASLVRTGRVFFDMVHRVGGMRRIQAYVAKHHKKDVQFAKAVYFVREATLRHYGPDGRDYELMVRFSED